VREQDRDQIKTLTPAHSVQLFIKSSADWVNDKPGSKTSFGDVTLERTADSAGRNPYLLAYVDKQLIRDHNDIDDPRVFEFVKQLILISIQSPEQAIRHLEMSATTP